MSHTRAALKYWHYWLCSLVNLLWPCGWYTVSGTWEDYEHQASWGCWACQTCDHAYTCHQWLSQWDSMLFALCSWIMLHFLHKYIQHLADVVRYHTMLVWHVSLASNQWEYLFILMWPSLHVVGNLSPWWFPSFFFTALESGTTVPKKFRAPGGGPFCMVGVFSAIAWVDTSFSFILFERNQSYKYKCLLPLSHYGQQITLFTTNIVTSLGLLPCSSWEEDSCVWTMTIMDTSYKLSIPVFNIMAIRYWNH